MVEETVVEPIVEPIQEPVVGPTQAPEPAQEEKIYTYQPTDEQGRSIGGKQVLKYKTQDELVQKIQEQNVLLIRKLREETRKLKLGIIDDDEIPETAKRRTEPRQYKARDLSAEERVKLSRDLLDPDAVPQAISTLFEATVGISPEELRKDLQNNQEERIRQAATNAANAFAAATPEFIRCADNAVAIANWVARKGLDPTDEANYHLAFQTLKRSGVLLLKVEGPPVPEPVVTPVQPVPVTPPTQSVEPEPTHPGIPTGFTRSEAGDTGPLVVPGSDIVYDLYDPATKQTKRLTGLAAVNAMPSEEYKRRINSDRAFQQKVDKLEAEAAKRRKPA